MTITFWQACLESCIAFVFLTAALGKIGSRSSIQPFLAQLGVPAAMTARVALAVPVVEIACAVALFGGFRAASGVFASALSAAFLLVLLFSKRVGVTESCRCFGPIEAAGVSWIVVVRAAVLSAASLAVLYLQLAGSVAPPLSAPAILAGATWAFVYVLGFALVDRVRDFERRRHMLFNQSSHHDPIPGMDGGDPL